MILTYINDYTIADLCNGFYYNELEGIGLYGLNGKLVIHPDYARNYFYNDGKKDAAVIDTLLNSYQIGMFSFAKTHDDIYELLDGQQRLTSIGRFIADKFAIIDKNGDPRYYHSLTGAEKGRILQYKPVICVCEGTELEIEDYYKSANIIGVPLTEQERLNALYGGPFVEKAKELFSNQQGSYMNKLLMYMKGDPKRQEILATALDWVSKGNVRDYMNAHRYDTDISEMKAYVDSVIDWIELVFEYQGKELKGLRWGMLYEQYHRNAYDKSKIRQQVDNYMADPYVTDKRGIFEYVLSGCTIPKLLNVRVFDEATKKAVYKEQTDEAIRTHTSNCPYCRIGHENTRTKIWPYSDMEADHVTAWSIGGLSDKSNCQMLCRPHNQAKGNR